MTSPASPIRPPLPSLRTPLSAGALLPSELPRSPYPIKRIKVEEDDLRTPITPPTAYTDFLKALSPALSTPTTGASAYSSFSFSDRGGGRLTPLSRPSSASFSSRGSRPQHLHLPRPCPADRHRTSSYGSNGHLAGGSSPALTPASAHGSMPMSAAPGCTTKKTTTTTTTTTSTTESSGLASPAPASCICESRPPARATASAPLIPPSPFVRPPVAPRASSARTPTTLRRLRIPSSPYGTVSESPHSSNASRSAATSTLSGPTSAATSSTGETMSASTSSASGSASGSHQSRTSSGGSSIGGDVPKGSGSSVKGNTVNGLRSHETGAEVITPAAAITSPSAPHPIVSPIGRATSSHGVGVPALHQTRSPCSPPGWQPDGQPRPATESPHSGAPRAVSIKQVVTRTVTYTSTPLGPAPKGRRRKAEDEQ